MTISQKIYSILRSRWFLPSVALFAFVVRLALILLTNKYGNTVFADELDYLKIGISLSHGGAFAKDGIHYTAYRPPAQPFVIAALFRIFGEHHLYLKIFEALILIAVPFVCFRLGRLLGLSVEHSNIGAALATLHPALAYASSTLYPTVLTAVALTVGVWLCTEALESNAVTTSIGAAIALGLAGSATTTFAPLAALSAVIMLMRRSYRAAFIIGVLGTLPVVLWMARNERVLGRFTVATNGGYNLYLGANNDATPMSGNWVEPNLFDESRIDEVQLDDDYKNAGVIWIKEHPVRWGELAAERAVVVFDSVGNPRTQGLHSGLLGHLMGWIMLPVVVFGVIGLFASYRNPAAWFTAAALMLIIASSAATIAKPRFRFPCDPLLAMFAVAGFLFIKKKASSGRKDALI